MRLTPPVSLGWRRRAADWFLRSGIQEPTGGVSRYYRGDSGLRLANSTEITGYAVAGLLHMGLGEEAKRAGDFLAERAWDPELNIFPFELEGTPRLTYFFDCGIIARGLMRLAEATGSERYWQAAEAAAHSMIRVFTADRGYHPIVELPSMQALEYTNWWSRRPGCFHLKAALAWRELWGPDDPDYKRQLQFSFESLSELLSGETDDAKLMDRLHPYCYFLEGLVPVATQHPTWMLSGIREVSYHLHRLSSRVCRSDVYAQLLRLRLLADSLDVVPLDHDGAAAEAEALASTQIESEDVRIDGAFAFGRRDGVLIPHANPVSTVFAVQALDWWNDYQTGRFASSWRELI
jgi:hypothetical protein